VRPLFGSMALVWGLSRLLAVDEEELRSQVQWANQQTFAPFFGLYHSVAPILGLAHSSEAPALPVIDESSSLSACPLAEQLSLSQDQDLEQIPERLGSAPLSPACPSLDPAVECAEDVLCEENLCRKEEALPSRTVEQNDDGNVQEAQAAELTLASSTTVMELDRDSLFQILAHADNSTLQACSLVCRDFLEMSNFARSVMSLQKARQVAALPTLLMRFPQLQTLHIKGLSDPLLADQPAGFCLDDAMMDVMAGCCRGLHELRLEACPAFSDEGLNLVLRACSELSCLRLVHCGGFGGKAFTGLSCSIRELELDSCRGLTNKGLFAAVRACPALEDLSLVTKKEANTVFAQGLEKSARLCGRLTKLKLHNCGIRDETLRSFAMSCPALIDVYLSCEHGMSEEGMAAFFLRLINLEKVTLNNNKQFIRIPRFG
jgi:hypothetical protein